MLRDRDDHLSDPDAMTIAADRPLRRRLGRGAARRDRPRPAPACPRPGIPSAVGPRTLCAAGDGLLVSLIQSNFLVVRIGGARARVGDQPQQPRLVVRARRVTRERARAVEAADAHADPRDGPARRPTRPRLRLDGRRRAGAGARAGAHVGHRRRRRPAGRDRRAAVAGGAVGLAGAGGGRHAIPPSSAPWTPAATSWWRWWRATSGMGHAHAIAIGPHGYAVATDPRAEGAAVGS